MKKRLSNKTCLGCASSDHFFQECDLNPKKKSNNFSRKVSKKSAPRDDRESDNDSDNSNESVQQKSRKSNFFSNNKKHSRVSMIRLPKPSDLEIGHEWYGFDTQAGIKVMTPDVSLTRNYRTPGINEDKLQSFDSRHEAKIDWTGTIGMCEEVQVVVGARNGIIGIEWLRRDLKLKIEWDIGQPLKIIDRNNRVLIYAEEFDGMPFIHVSQVMDLCCRAGLTVSDHLAELKVKSLSQTEYADCTTAKMMRDAWMERELILSNSDEELFETFTKNQITERQECWIHSETLRARYEPEEATNAKVCFRIPSEFVRRVLVRNEKFTRQRMRVIRVNDGILDEARTIITSNGRTRELETLKIVYNRHAEELLARDELIFEEDAREDLTIGPEFNRVMPNRRFKLVDVRNLLKRGSLYSPSVFMEYKDDYGPRSNLDPHQFGQDTDEGGSYEEVLLRLHNYLVFKNADRRVAEMKLTDTNELQPEVVKEIHEEVMNSVSWTENNAIAFLEFEDRIADQFKLNLEKLKTQHALTLLRLNKDRLVQLEEEEQDKMSSKLASEPMSEEDAELSSELLKLILSSQKKNLKACNGGSEEMLNDHKDVREKMTEIVELHASRRAMLERIMELQDTIGAKLEMTGDDFDQLAEIQTRIHSRRV
jgi:hypothetical protein